jgi:hypothetical protein
VDWFARHIRGSDLPSTKGPNCWKPYDSTECNGLKVCKRSGRFGSQWSEELDVVRTPVVSEATPNHRDTTQEQCFFIDYFDQCFKYSQDASLQVYGLVFWLKKPWWPKCIEASSDLFTLLYEGFRILNALKAAASGANFLVRRKPYCILNYLQRHIIDDSSWISLQSCSIARSERWTWTKTAASPQCDGCCEDFLYPVAIIAKIWDISLSCRELFHFRYGKTWEIIQYFLAG